MDRISLQKSDQPLYGNSSDSNEVRCVCVLRALSWLLTYPCVHSTSSWLAAIPAQLTTAFCSLATLPLNKGSSEGHGPQRTSSEQQIDHQSGLRFSPWCLAQERDTSRTGRLRHTLPTAFGLVLESPVIINTFVDALCCAVGEGSQSTGQVPAAFPVPSYNPSSGVTYLFSCHYLLNTL